MSNVTSLHVNGAARRCDADAARPLLSVLRDDLALTGAKYGCGEGQCGACTVLVDGVPVRSCLTPCGTVGPQKITTVEGLARDSSTGLSTGGRLHALQEAFHGTRGVAPSPDTAMRIAPGNLATSVTTPPPSAIRSKPPSFAK